MRGRGLTSLTPQDFRIHARDAAAEILFAAYIRRGDPCNSQGGLRLGFDHNLRTLRFDRMSGAG